MVGDPPYRVCIDAGHGGSDPGARGVVEEKEMTAQTSEALLALLEADPNYIPLRSRESYDVTAKPSERAEAINAQSPQLLLSIHGNSAPEGSAASGFECYPSVPGRTWHQESYYFAQQLAQGMQAAGAKLRGHGGIRYIYYQGEVKQLVESTHTEVFPALISPGAEQRCFPKEKCCTEADDTHQKADDRRSGRAALSSPACVSWI